jgi:hypothetical protein
MSHIDLLVDSGSPLSLTSFATHFFSLARIENFERRSSENYVDGYYFLAKASQGSIRVMLSDDDSSHDFRFWIQLTATSGNVSHLEKEGEALATELVRHGYKVAKCIDFGRNNEQRLDYLPKLRV